MKYQKYRLGCVLLFVMLFAIYAGAQTLSLQQCIELALANNIDLQKSELSLKQASLSSKQSWSSLYPGVTASASASNSGPIVSEYEDEWNWSAGLGVSQKIYSPGLYTNISLAKANRKTAQFSNVALQNHICATVEQLYYQILTADTLVSVYKANIRLSEEQMEKMKRMVDLGTKRESDLLKSQVQKGTFEAQLIQQIENLSSSKRELNILMGREPNEPVQIVAIPVDQMDVPSYEESYALMLDTNPSLKQYEKQIDIEGLSLRIAKEAYLPSASASYSYSQSNSAYDGSVVDNDQISLRLSMDLFDGFSKCQTVQKAKVGVDNAKLDYEAELRDLTQSLLNKYNSLNTQNQLLKIHQTNLTSASKDLEVVSKQYASGLASILDLMDAQVSVLESQINLLSDLYERKSIESEIFRLIGSR